MKNSVKFREASAYCISLLSVLHLSKQKQSHWLTTWGFSFFYISGALSKDHLPSQSFEIFLSAVHILEVGY